MSNPCHVLRVKALYRRILFLHKFLPVHLKALGDQYVKDEFKRNKKASPEQAQSFLAEWEIYKDTLQNQVTEILRNKPNGIQVGVNLTDAQLNQFQEEQIGQLYQLMTESTKPCQQFNIQDSPDHK
ncbi:succinate dehydrogenase assembly factor 3, mitochondrial [Polypterus senegalus]|uniref:succinate dehydrogenase assembly factor 3, mitochondrial n=1 Tax=Polypterus senegalus TaxID=55291 RepID=UPI0019632550|nr:succinate dehydrogenase assembly factor 3, mitochondrial [Polypterus senegalus]